MKVQFPEKFTPLFQPRRMKAVHGGRGSGKSHSMAGALILMGAQRNLRWLCLRELQKSIDASVKKLMEDKIQEYNLQHMYRSTNKNIFGKKNGTVFHFLGMKNNPESVKSMEGLDGAWFEEASNCSAVSLELLIPTIRKMNSELWFSWNRRLLSDPVDAYFLGNHPPPPEEAWIEQVNYIDNPWFWDSPMPTEMARLKSVDYDRYMHVWEGEPLQSSKAAIFRNWRIEDLTDSIPEKAVPRFGADWGFSIDPTVLIKVYRWISESGQPYLYISNEACETKCEIDDLPSLFAGTDPKSPKRWRNKNKYEGIEGALFYQIVADPTRPETISKLRSQGFNIRGAKRGADSVYEGVRFLQTHEIIVHPECERTITELGLYRYKLDTLSGDVLPELHDKNNHTIDSLRYALENDRKAENFQFGGGFVATHAEVIHVAS